MSRLSRLNFFSPVTRAAEHLDITLPVATTVGVFDNMVIFQAVVGVTVGTPAGINPSFDGRRDITVPVELGATTSLRPFPRVLEFSFQHNLNQLQRGKVPVLFSQSVEFLQHILLENQDLLAPPPKLPVHKIFKLSGGAPRAPLHHLVHLFSGQAAILQNLIGPGRIGKV